MKKLDKNKTLFALIIKSTSSGAIYLWHRNTDETIIIGGQSKDRSLGAIPSPIFTEKCFGINKENKIIHLDNISNPHYKIIKEIHTKKLSINIPEVKKNEILFWRAGKWYAINSKTQKAKLIKS